MKHRLILFMVLIICIMFCGCDWWMDGEYVSVKPHEENNLEPEQQISEIMTYSQLRQALVSLVESGVKEQVFSIPRLEQRDIGEYMELATTYVTQLNAIGAYSVDKIEYELGMSAGKPAIAVKISYIHDRSDMVRMQRVETMTEVYSAIEGALKECAQDVVVLVSKYDSVDLVQMVEDYSNSHPEYVMEVPQVTASVYPDVGVERIIEITFTYQNSRLALRTMQERVLPVFTSAELYVSGDAPPVEKYAQLYSFLMERYDYKIQTSITPSYSLLRHGVGDCRAFANVYAAMCRLAGLECQVVSGTHEGKAWWWNVIRIDDTNYHLDLLQGDQFVLRTEIEMSGYVWDFTAYPAKID